MLGIIDSDQELVVEYTYDPWGKPLATTPRQLSTDIPPEEDETEEQTAERLALIDHNTQLNNLYLNLASLNPFRYRGYLFDDETQLYYLRSRYYNPEWGRFINADCVIIDASDHDYFLGNNLLAYCGNNPICRIDEEGESFGDFLRNVGSVLKKTAQIVGLVGGALLLVGGAVGLTIGSGGAGAAAIPFAVQAGIAMVGTAIAVGTTGAALETAGNLVMQASTNRPNNNQRQNDQFDAAMRRAGINDRDLVRLIHDNIHKKGANLKNIKEIMEFALELLKEKGIRIR